MIPATSEKASPTIYTRRGIANVAGWFNPLEIFMVVFGHGIAFVTKFQSAGCTTIPLSTPNVLIPALPPFVVLTVSAKAAGPLAIYGGWSPAKEILTNGPSVA
jgi:hypothetical protein